MIRTACTLMLLLMPSILPAQMNTIRVGAKHFNEGYILSEMIALLLEDGGFSVERKFNLGGTAVSFEALRNNAIDVYPEYTGTIASEILKYDQRLKIGELNAKLKLLDLEISAPYGFDNTYALLIDSVLSKKHAIRKISDLQHHAYLTLGLSYEFLKRKDGWENLAQFYVLPQQPTALEHGLAYQAILEHKIDVTDAYSTDGEIEKYHLVLLDDDKNFFPQYEAVSFYGRRLPAEAKKLLQKLEGAISQDDMQRLNALALFNSVDHRKIAFDFLVQKGLINNKTYTTIADARAILEKTWVHLQLTLLALICSILVAVPLGMLIYRYSYMSRVVLYITGILQTIPSIALLALMIPVLGIGMLPAVIALFLYALLPILRNTVMGLVSVDPVLKNVATAIGLSPWNKLRLVEFPMAFPAILGGIRTAAVINIGTATLAAFIGAGGLGEFIVSGLALNNTTLILQGAIPSALLAILMELIFEGIQWLAVPKHMQQNSST
ncbi:MAG: ABC transporter permease subunit [Cyclobacteriaceae bacterium]|nr:ABC transporter permease subunit [Cyclobacteriaceae bacterium]